MKTIHKIALALVVLVLLVGVMVGIAGHRQVAAITPQGGATQVAQEQPMEVPEWGPIFLEGEWDPGQICVAWNS
jgi:hypothetical protein